MQAASQLPPCLPARKYEIENTETRSFSSRNKIVNIVLTLDLPCELLPAEYRFRETLRTLS
jgi:hypothetical protein